MLTNTEKQMRYSRCADCSINTNFQGSEAEDVRNRKYNHRLHRYFYRIISIIRDSDSIWIFGPGEAKAEIENRLQKAELGARVVGIFMVERMTTLQIVARVQAHSLL